MIGYTAHLKDFISPEELKRKLGVNPGGHVQKAVDDTVILVCREYVPFREGILEGSASTATEVGSGEVIYDTAYARYLYYGEVYGPNFPLVENGVITGWRSRKHQPKHETGRKLEYDTEWHPMAGSHWFDRAMADHKDDVLKEAQDAADRGSYP